MSATATLSLSETLRARRERLDLSQAELAELARCSLGSVRALEGGLIPQRSRVLRQVEHALDLMESGSA